MGYLPYAPGTFGSAVAFLTILLLHLDDIKILIILPPLFLLGFLASHHAEKILGKDSGHIVIDEFCGCLAAVLFLPKNIAYLTAAFVLFRAFDILKPPPIRKIEEIVPGGMGIMLDDLLAGIYTCLCLQLWRYLSA
jgi:phosphatidylglycerophosphatase A